MSSTTKRVLVLQHAEPEHLGRIAAALTHEHVEYGYLRPDLGQVVPSSLDGYGGLVVMGGPQSVYEEDQFPYLKAEKTLVRHAVVTNRPVLGVCLGSQILAEVLGSRVRPGGTFEVGWKNVTLSTEATDDPILGHLSKVITPLNWHGDVYDLPPDARLIGSSELTPVQGFASKGRFYGLLFHLETTIEQLTAMVEVFPDDVRRGGMTPSTLIEEAPSRLEALRETGFEVFRRWAALVS